MQRRLVVLAIAVLALPVAFAQSKSKKHDLPAVFANAHYVYVRALDGDIMKPGLYPEDRQAISDMQDGLRDWNRYALTIEQEHADLVFVVRKGRSSGEQNRVGISGRQQPMPPGSQPRQQGQMPDDGTGVGVGAEVGPSDDILQVFTTNPEGKLIGPLWQREMHDGLEAPAIPLLRQLRAAVELAYPDQPAKKP